MSAVKSTLWTHTGNPYHVFKLLNEDPRIPKTTIARKLKINAKTAEKWYNDAVALRIIIPPFFRRKSFTNFREYFYFINTNDPYECYQRMKSKKEVMYCTVQSGFSDMQIISKAPLNLEEEVILSGERSDYYVSTPKDQMFEKANQIMERKLKTIDDFEPTPSPLILRKEPYSQWDDLDEAVYYSLMGNLRKPWAHVLKESGAYNNKIMHWYRTRNEFGHTITTFFPEGEKAYQPTLFAIETENDALLIDIFSEMPTSSVFYRLNKYVIMVLYVSYPIIAKSMVRRVLSYLQKKELIGKYINSIVEYYYRED